MTLPSTPEISIYELTQGMDQPPSPLKVTPAMLSSLVGAIIDLLQEQRVKTTLWVRFPPRQNWSEKIEDYFNFPTCQKVYLCNTSSQNITSRSLYNVNTRNIVSLELEANSKLKEESFLVILSPEFCTAMVIQSKNNLNSEINLICTFEESIIRKILQTIKQLITITDDTPSEILTENDLSFTFPPSSLLGNLLIKHLEANQENRSENQLPQVETPLIASNEFLNTLVRELLPSITNVKTALRLLESKQIPDKRKRYMELLQKECAHQTSLITRFQELLELDQLQPEDLDLKQSLEDLVAGIISTYQPLAQEKGIQLGYTVPPGFSTVVCPAPWLRQIIINLVNNSLKFTPSGGKVNVQATKQENAIAITVTDTGIGISPQEQTKIFDSFYRAKNPNNESDAGLGLTIVKEILHRCGGEISISSTQGKGSVFKVLIPMENRPHP